jgi:MFS family permease
LIAGIGLVFLQQITGQPSVLYYAAGIFDEAGLAAVATVGVAAFKLIMTMVAVFTVDKFGRKLLLYVGTGIMLISLVALSIAFKFAPETDDDNDDDKKSLNSVQVCVVKCSDLS